MPDASSDWNSPLFIKVQLKPMIKIQISGRMASIGLSDL